MIQSSRHKMLSHLIISSCFGHSGMGMIPYILYPPFWILLLAAWKTKTAIIAKSTTRHKHRGNFILWNPKTWRFIHRIKNRRSILNAHGVTNPGVWICAIMIKIAWILGFNVIPSLAVDLTKDYENAHKETLGSLAIFRKVLGEKFSIFELNPTCPSLGKNIPSNQRSVLRLCEAIKKEFPYLILIVKGSIVYPGSFYKQLEEAGVDITHIINTIPFDVAVKLGISPYLESPLGEKTKGGYSGNIIMQPAFNYAMSTVVPATTVPLIFGGGISEYMTILRYTTALNEKKDARNVFFAICTAATYNPIETASLIWRFNQ